MESDRLERVLTRLQNLAVSFIATDYLGHRAQQAHRSSSPGELSETDVLSLLKLVLYGEEDDDDEDVGDAQSNRPSGFICYWQLLPFCCTGITEIQIS